jgi:hypothetical protein
MPVAAYIAEYPTTTSPHRDLAIVSWNGDAWQSYVESNTSPNGAMEVASFAFAVDAAGRAAVVWSGGPTPLESQIYFRRWDGSAWTELDGSGSGNGISNTTFTPAESPALALDPAGQPIVAWTEQIGSPELAVNVLGWDGSAWVEYADSAAGFGVAYPVDAFSLAVDPAGQPVIAWSSSVTSTRNSVFLVRYDGTSWQGLGGSGAGYGISSSSAIARSPSLALDGAGHPVVAWEDREPGVSAIYLRRWNGAFWVEWPTGSATGGGVSNSAGNAFAPSLRLAGDVACVAWHEMISNSSNEIVARCFAGPL